MFPLTGFKRAALFLIAPGLVGWVLGCNSSTQPTTSGQIVMVSGYSEGISASLQSPMPDAQGTAASEVDSVIVTRARFALRDIKFKTQSDSATFRTSPFVLEMNLNGILQEISAADVPFGSYRRIEFDVHKITANEVAQLLPEEQAEFQDFLVGGGKSVIVYGWMYKADGPHDFTFYSALNVNQKVVLPQALEVSETYPVAHVTMMVAAGDWFRDSKDGLLDPMDPSNENTISQNISRSVHVFKDTDRDGNPD